MAAKLKEPDFADLIQRFIRDQEHPKSDFDTSLMDLPSFYGKITVYPSAIATFYAPSDLSGVGGMRRECLHVVKSWRNGPRCFDTVFVNTDPVEMGMWVVEEMDDDGDECPVAILHLDTIVHAAHLLPVFGSEQVSPTLSFTDTLNIFTSFNGNLKSQYHFATAPPVPPGLLPFNPLSMNRQALKNSKTACAGLPSQWLDGGSTFPDDRSLSSPNSSDLSLGGGSPPLPHINSLSILPSNQGAEDEIIPTAIVIKNIPFIVKRKTLLKNHPASSASLEPNDKFEIVLESSLSTTAMLLQHIIWRTLWVTKPLERSKAVDCICKHYARFKLEKKGIEIANVVPTPWHWESGKAREGGHLTVEFVRRDGTSLRRQHVYPTDKAYGCWWKSEYLCQWTATSIPPVLHPTRLFS
ncbi:hypothetical protein EI94DRAFT_1711440 [Lactarius quietus]|nr:hypothetical protein EI94DRAFT_1711440 [Lactarius quietus]